MEMQQDTITAVAGIFSGRQNPEVSLSGANAEELARLVKGTVGKQSIHAPPQPRLGYYYGFAVRASAPVAKRLGLPEQFNVFYGVVSEVMDRKQRHWRDVTGVERFLIDQAYQQGHGELLKRVGVENPAQGR